jgi:hypothetical protein
LTGVGGGGGLQAEAGGERRAQALGHDHVGRKLARQVLDPGRHVDGAAHEGEFLELVAADEPGGDAPELDAESGQLPVAAPQPGAQARDEQAGAGRSEGGGRHRAGATMIPRQRLLEPGDAVK